MSELKMAATIRGFLMLTCLLAMSDNFAAAAPPTDEGPPRGWSEDAELEEITFANTHEGWAVGDRGVIWHTADGGAEWTLQETHVRTRFTGVSFVDARNGWAVGGEDFAYLSGSRGVVLSTRDGGENWVSADAALLSKVRGIRGFTTQHARLWGSRSAIFPHTIGWTADGGRSWNPLAGVLADDCQDGNFLSPSLGAIVTRQGEVYQISERASQHAKHPDAGLRQLHRVAFSDERHGVIVGDGGLTWLSEDGARTWVECNSMRGQVAEAIDFRALAVKGPHIWAAGSPGTVIAHSADFGKSWEWFPTPRQLPINALYFADTSTGWACGALGTILHTSNGGRDWQVQRAGGARAGFMAIVADADSAPWELLAQCCGQQGAIGHTHFIARRDWLQPDSDDRGSASALRGAVSAVGASSAERSWRFPAMAADCAFPSEDLVALWDRLHNGESLPALERELVVRLRTWRPEVLVTHAPQAGGDPLKYVLNQMTLQAAERAADANYEPELMNGLRLGAWQVSKIYGALPPGRVSGERLASAQLAPELGKSLGQQAALARALVCEAPTPAETMLGFRLLSSRLPESASGRGILGGVALQPGENARRPDADYARDGERLRLLALKQRNLHGILARLGDDRESSALMAQLPELIRSLGAESAAPLLFDLAARQHAAGHLDTAADCYAILAERYPRHALAAPAMTWLLQSATSAELAFRAQRQADQGLAQATRTGQVVMNGEQVQLAAAEEANPELNDPAKPTLVATPSAQLSRAQAIHRQLTRYWPTLASEPYVLFPLAALERRGANTPPKQSLQSLLPGGAGAAWRSAAAAEVWHAQGAAGACPQEVWRCRPATSRPKLDGVLDDDLWSGGGDIELAGVLDADGWPTNGMAAHDEQFLYLAFACVKSARIAYEPPTTTRERDGALRDADRLEISLDIDRDRVTAWEFTIDARGRIRDACWGDPSWNPKWYVAVQQDERAWYVEMAIPLQELAPLPLDAKSPWCARIQRVAPGVGEQGWTTGHGARSTLADGGWLVFE